jgi:hypothetical protein
MKNPYKFREDESNLELVTKGIFLPAYLVNGKKILDSRDPPIEEQGFSRKQAYFLFGLLEAGKIVLYSSLVYQIGDLISRLF